MCYGEPKCVGVIRIPFCAVYFMGVYKWGVAEPQYTLH